MLLSFPPGVGEKGKLSQSFLSCGIQRCQRIISSAFKAEYLDSSRFIYNTKKCHWEIPDDQTIIGHALYVYHFSW